MSERPAAPIDEVLADSMHRAQVRASGAEAQASLAAERQQAAEALRRISNANESRFRAWFDSASPGVVAIDDTGRITLVNTSTEEMFGYRRDELVGQPLAIILPERYRTGYAEHERACFAHPHKRPVVEVRGRKKDGAEFPLEVGLSFVEEGGVRSALAFITDISERSRAAEALGEIQRDLMTKNSQLEGLFQHSPVGLAIFDAEPPYQVLTHNRIYQQFSDEPFRSEGMLGKYIPDYMPQAEQNGMFEIFREVARTGNGKTLYAFPYEGLRRGKTWWNWNLSPVLLEGKVKAFAHMLIEVTEEVQARESLAATEGRFRALLESASQGVLAVDDGGCITLVNAKPEEMFGYHRDELVGQPLEVLLPERFRAVHGDYQRTYFAHPRSRAMGLGGDLTGRKKDGSEFPLEASLSFVEQGESRMALALITDITERRRTQEALRESEAQFRTLANAIPQLCWTANAGGLISWYNQRWYEYTGTTPGKMEGWGSQSVHDPEALPEVLDRWQGSMASGEPFDMVLPLRGADGVF